ncbi:hypothetical protein AC11_1566 [Escherichia coli 6-537-08_S3_C1]|nr:hypothetical protein AC11_1566 [Escherichia coli 6-537-08_S3_C1]KEM84492.1 hypothetical protein AC64_1551 [Escherichia coli 6-537-08_S3_C3]
MLCKFCGLSNPFLQRYVIDHCITFLPEVVCIFIDVQILELS